MTSLLSKTSKKDRKKYNSELLEYFTKTFPVIESILNESGESTMEVKRLRTLALEVFKTINNMNPEHMKEIFHKTAHSLINLTAFSTHRPLNLEVNENHTTKYGNTIL